MDVTYGSNNGTNERSLGITIITVIKSNEVETGNGRCLSSHNSTHKGGNKTSGGKGVHVCEGLMIFVLKRVDSIVLLFWMADVLLSRKRKLKFEAEEGI